MKYIIALLALSISFPAIAQESTNTQTLNLYPKGREAYAQKFRDRGEQYEVEGRNYIDDLYTNRGENTAKSSEPLLPESTLDAVLDNAQSSPASDATATTSPPDISNGTTTTP